MRVTNPDRSLIEINRCGPAHVVVLGRVSNIGFLGDHGSLELSTLADANHVVFLEHQPVAVDVDLALADDPAHRWHA